MDGRMEKLHEYKCKRLNPWNNFILDDAIIEKKLGETIYRNYDGEIHRNNGPAIVFDNGYEMYFLLKYFLIHLQHVK